MNNFIVKNKDNQRIGLLGYPIDLVDLNKACAICLNNIKNEVPMHIVTINAEMIMMARNNPILDNIIGQADLVIPDGSSIVLSLKLAKISIPRLPGIELAYKLIELASVNNFGIALIGAKPQTLPITCANLQKTFPNLNILTSHNGYFNEDEEETIVTDIAKTKPKIVFVALGVPRQEYFINKWRHLFPQAILIGVGGSFDVWANTVKRAPKIFCDLHLEWFYRLIKEPWRFSRMASSLPQFMGIVLASFISQPDNTFKIKDFRKNETNG